MKTISKTGLVAAIAAGCMLAVAAPALAYGGHGGGGRGGGGGHAFAGGGHGFRGGGRGGYARGGYGGGYGRGGYGYGGGWGYGAAVLGGLGVGYALNPYYDDAYDDDYAGGPDQCVSQQQVWDPNAGRYVVEPAPYAC